MAIGGSPASPSAEHAVGYHRFSPRFDCCDVYADAGRMSSRGYIIKALTPHGTIMAGAGALNIEQIYMEDSINTPGRR